MSITATQKNAMQDAAETALAAPQAAELAAPDLDASLKTFFCQHWDIIKQVLKFLADQIGGPIGWIVKPIAKALIAAGDALHENICD